MKQSEIDFIESVNNAIAKCPRVASGFGSPTAAVGTYVKAYNDFSEVVQMGTVAIAKYLQYKGAEKHLKNPEMDIDWISETLAEAFAKRDELVSFVEQRAMEGWG